jgi:hypothetical protein
MNILSTAKLGFTALTLKEKFIVFGALLLALIASHVAVGYVWYNKGKNLSAIEISKYESRIHELQSKVDTGQVVVNDRIVTKLVDHNNVVTHTVYVNRDVIRTVVVERPGSFSNGWLEAHNQSALGLTIDSTKAADAAPSGVTDKAALEVIASNYGKYHTCLNTVNGWNEWYLNTKKLYDDNGKVPTEKK